MSELTTPQTQSFLERASRDPTIDVHKLEQLIALQERVVDREARRQFAEAMNALQEEMPPITRDRTNPHARSRYATYESIDGALRPLYTKHGFSVRFTTHATNNRIRVGCTVSHIGGHSESENELESGPDLTGSKGQLNKTEVQGIGSIVSYLKRYTLMAAFAVALTDDETDDDGAPTTMRDYAAKVQNDPAMMARQGAGLAVMRPGEQATQPSVREWFDALKAEMDAATTPEAAEVILERFPGGVPPDWLTLEKMPRAYETFVRMRQAMLDRLWPPLVTQQDLPIEGEEKAGA